MRNVKVQRNVAARPAQVWAVLADYPNIAEWNDGVLNSYAVGDSVEGVGAQRRCELGAKGDMKMRETVTEWVPERTLAVAIDEIEKQPVKRATMTFTLADGVDSAPLTMSYDYEPKGGPLALLFGPILDRLMQKGFNGFIDSLEPAAQAQAAA